MTASPAHTFIHRVGEPIEFEGYADDFENAVAGVQFSLDDGVSWTTYPTEGVRSDRGVRWTFAYTPQVPAQGPRGRRAGRAGLGGVGLCL